jgi:hypothetical protein
MEMAEAVHGDRPIVEAVEEGDLDRLRAEIRSHYLTGFPH